MKVFNITLLLLFFGALAQAQEYRLNITVLNAENREPVSYATIMYLEQQYGFSANTSGKFTIRVNKVEFERKISVSSIGFEAYNTTLGALVRDTVSEILLTPKITVLDELMIKAEAETPLSIIDKTIKKMPDFLGNYPYYLYMFYQESLRRRDVHVGFTEGYGIMHVTGYEKALKAKNKLFKMDMIQWKNIRRSDYDIKDDCDSLKFRLLGIKKLMKAKMEYLYRGPLTKNGMEFYKYDIDSLTSYQGKDVFIIGFQPKRWEGDTQYQGQLYVKADDYALLALKVSQKNSKDIIFNECNVSDVNSEFELSYTQIGKKYYINNLSLKNTFDDQEEVIKIRGGEFKDNKVSQLNYQQRVILYNEMINPSIKYNKDFWQDHGDDIPKIISKDLSTDTALEDQFDRHKGLRLEPLPAKFKDYQTLYTDRSLFKLYFNGDL